MKFELAKSIRKSSDEELLKDLSRCAKANGRATITKAEYEQNGLAHPSVIERRFGKLSNALKLAGLQPSRSQIVITDEELFENKESLWVSIGRQPCFREVIAPNSKFTGATYKRRFGSWSNALRKFVIWVNSDTPNQSRQEVQTAQAAIKGASKTSMTKLRTRRDISDRQRFRILVRDGFRCKACGRSPLTEPGIELHVDHVIPWSMGGETTDDNLKTKCKRCNLGKGNAFNV